MKKNTHHQLHALRALLLGLLIITVSFVRLESHSLPSITQNNQAVLAYATSISRAELFAENNASRAKNGLASFSLDARLNNSAQAKAQNMADNNYWSHVAPDGTQPWAFFEAAGYSYSTAGENLAYGFTSSYTTNQGWMNSEGHRANILGDYSDVGYGIVNTPNFQGGEFTIVVAHYGKPLSGSTNGITGASSTPPSATQPTIQSSEQATNASDPSPTTTAITEPTKNNTASSQPTIIAPVRGNFVTGSTKQISVFESLRFGSMPTIVTVSLVITLMISLGFALTHRALLKHALATSEHFVIAHPALDVMAIITAIALILTTTIAWLQ